LLFFPILLHAQLISSSSQKSLGHTLTTETRGIGGFDVNTSIGMALDPELITGLSHPDTLFVPATGKYTALKGLDQLYAYSLAMLYGLNNYTDISLSLPIYHERTRFKQDLSHLGNLALDLKIRYPGDQESLALKQAYYLKLIAPTTSGRGGFYPEHAYQVRTINQGFHDFTNEQWVLQPMMIWSLYLNRLNPTLSWVIHTNFGAAINQSTALIASLAIQYIYSPFTSYHIEIAGESRISHYIDQFSWNSLDDDKLFVGTGFQTRWKNGVYTQFSLNAGLSDYSKKYHWKKDAYSYSVRATPLVSVNFTLGWSGLAKALDSDRDGIPDESDKCPHEPEDYDRFEDDDGCPDVDNDKDGIPDSLDNCPLLYVKVDGCPVNDKDGDKIFDNIDKCPLVPEDYDGFQDEDGCPDTDNDQDGIPDSLDRCPDRAEDLDGFEDLDGCPDYDNDKDGIPDSLDNCPLDRGFFQNKGCPTQKIDGKTILRGVSFNQSSAVLTQDSYRIINQAIEKIQANPEQKMEILAYTDSTGSEDANKALSQKRADALVVYMLSKGLSVKNLIALGMGSQNPVASNSTEEGRKKNRRVEIRFLNE